MPKIGVWQYGPVTADWSGFSSVMVCSDCSWTHMQFDDAGIGDVARAHIYRVHASTDRACVEVREPVRILDIA